MIQLNIYCDFYSKYKYGNLCDFAKLNHVANKWRAENRKINFDREEIAIE